MIDQVNLGSLFQELDKILTKTGQQRNIIVYGGAALISMGITDRATIDVDVFQPKLDPTLLQAIREVGERHLLGECWVNSTGDAFIKELPDGWKDRLCKVYFGECLQVSSLGRIDMIFTKLLAELDRQEDLEDIKKLNPTSSELELIKPYLLNLEDDKVWKAKVKQLIRSLKELRCGK